MEQIDNESYYKISNFDTRNDFFMTITSSSNIWNFCWAAGGITAGRKNSEHALFPYYTADKLKDSKSVTGPFAAIRITNDGKRGNVWLPFSEKAERDISLSHNLYKNQNGSKIWFEEVNARYGLSYMYGWTSSDKFGLVKMNCIKNLSASDISLTIIDGCRNILSPGCTTDLQNNKSILLDAYKTAQVDSTGNLALFTLSSLVTDKAEPMESLTANVSWFTTDDRVIVCEDAVDQLFYNEENTYSQTVLNGVRPDCCIIHRITVKGGQDFKWYQVLDTDYNICQVKELQNFVKDKTHAEKLLLQDIKDTDKKLSDIIECCDGVQTSGNEMVDLHHRTNVMFNTMRGGYFYNSGKINIKDFLNFVYQRNKEEYRNLKVHLSKLLESKEIAEYREILVLVIKSKNNQLYRLFMEYIPVTFSRRHGDPSRPWNIFNIDIQNNDGSPKLYYEGNWRDIFQNWEASLWSNPLYAQNIVCKFLNATTIEGYNPYRITTSGIDWEVPEKNNPWSQYGYWGDHQIVYLERLLSLFFNFDKFSLFDLLDKKVFSSANIPYRLKSFNQIISDPRHSIDFDWNLNNIIKEEEKIYGTDCRLCQTKDKKVALASMNTKLIQLILTKLLNLVPDAGIWMNTQRPEWNDANNALAGWGTSVVTACQLYKMLNLLCTIYTDAREDVVIDSTVYQALEQAEQLYSDYKNTEFTDETRYAFVKKAGLIFEAERTMLYSNGFAQTDATVKNRIFVSKLRTFMAMLAKTINNTKHNDGLYGSYNTITVEQDKIRINTLKLMLEGQVAAISSSLLSKKQVQELLTVLKKSPLYEPVQKSYMLYPYKTLLNFEDKNKITEQTITDYLGSFKNDAISTKIITKDIEGYYHFDFSIVNRYALDLFIQEHNVSTKNRQALHNLYEKVFNHSEFTGRSGTFFRYEGIGCIYWHMVSKLVLAVAEHMTSSEERIFSAYQMLKRGLGYSKKSEEYGAFPQDPYSHTPYGKGAAQPGMTGQVKEEIIARFIELGLSIKDSCAVFNSKMINQKDFDTNGELSFTWCGTSITYVSKKELGITVIKSNDEIININGNELPPALSKELFYRTGSIKKIIVSARS